jgi:hypothetical protein
MQIAFPLLNCIDMHHTHIFELLRLESVSLKRLFCFFDTLGCCAGKRAAYTAPTAKIFSTDLVFAFSAVMGGGS